MAYTTINKPSEYFNTKLYTGNGSTQSITGVNFQPDWVVCKDRSAISDHLVFDILRGATNYIKTNSANPQSTISTTLTSFDADGFSIGSNGGINTNGNNYVSWNWLGGGTGVSNTNGSIASTVSANTTSGFSVVTYTGTASNGTVGHGLGAKPAMIIAKNLITNGEDWCVYHKSLGYNNVVKLNSISASLSTTTRWNAEPDTSVFNVGTVAETNGSGTSQVAYVFVEKKGYSKFGSYTGNANTDGTFIYTGFKPAWFLIKPTGGGQWFLWDNKRNPINQAQQILSPEANYAEGGGAGSAIDFLSNGIKMRNIDGGINGNGASYIYMAFAENSLVGTNGVPATAR